MERWTAAQLREAVSAARQRVLELGLDGEDAQVAVTALTVGILNGKTGGSVRNPEPSDEFPLTFAEWASAYNIEGHRERFLVAAYYLRSEQNQKTFDHTDIMRLYENARWSKPANPADVLGKSANVGYLTEVERPADSETNAKLWQLTRTGYTFVQSIKKEPAND